jgi:hypothetical protein
MYSVLLRLVSSNQKNKYLPDMRNIKVNLEITNFQDDIPALEIGVIFGEDFELTNSYKLAMLQDVIDLMHQYCKLYASSSAVTDVFQLFIDVLDGIPEANPSIQVFGSNLAIYLLGKDIFCSLIGICPIKTKTINATKKKSDCYQDLCSQIPAEILYRSTL